MVSEISSAVIVVISLIFILILLGGAVKLLEKDRISVSMLIVALSMVVLSEGANLVDNILNDPNLDIKFERILK